MEKTETSRKSYLALGTTFLAVGVAFLSVGFAARIAAYYSIGPAMVCLGTVFLSVARRKPAESGEPPYRNR